MTVELRLVTLELRLVTVDLRLVTRRTASCDQMLGQNPQLNGQNPQFNRQNPQFNMRAAPDESGAAAGTRTRLPSVHLPEWQPREVPDDMRPVGRVDRRVGTRSACGLELS